eukprot:scaffold86358_cov47-Cyclotella_meneghiniana.AAC.1
MVAFYEYFRRPVLSIIVGGYAMEWASAARNEGSDKPSVIRIRWAAAWAAATTIVDTCRSAMYRFAYITHLLAKMRRLGRIRRVRRLLAWSSAITAEFTATGAVAGVPISNTYHAQYYC